MNNMVRVLTSVIANLQLALPAMSSKNHLQDTFEIREDLTGRPLKVLEDLSVANHFPLSLIIDERNVEPCEKEITIKQGSMNMQQMVTLLSTKIPGYQIFIRNEVIAVAPKKISRDLQNFLGSRIQRSIGKSSNYS